MRSSRIRDTCAAFSRLRAASPMRPSGVDFSSRMTDPREVKAGTAMARRLAMTPIHIDALGSVRGGMKYSNIDRMSTNVEDRRGMTREQSLSVPSPKAPPIVQSPRYPGDLPSQLGIDHIGKKR
jgi:hypothetical protein